MMTHTNQEEDEGADFERKAIQNLDAKRKEEVNWSYSKNKGREEIKSLETTSNQQRPDQLEKTTIVDDRQIKKL